ncbi:hypothetical protein [Paludisphaera soli]|uniref:hypothetical protein n=1 Tax=Paludisphaera soli TaxID=2712865 RepID=UPI0013EACA26|nr:hypothetical protein [Paludisphaera soli]
MPIRRSLTIVACCGVAFALTGGALGTALGLGVPSYYRGVFRRGAEFDFNPVRVGLGLGATQGAVVGILVGCVAVLAAAIAGRPRPGNGAAADPAPRPSLARLACFLLVGLVLVATGGLVGFVGGALSAEGMRARRDLDRLLPILQEPAFRGLSADLCFYNEIHLDGAVGSEEDRRNLEGRLRSLYGDAQAKELADGIPIAPPDGEAGEIRPHPSPADSD